jgi:hypothetical protein
MDKKKKVLKTFFFVIMFFIIMFFLVGSVSAAEDPECVITEDCEGGDTDHIIMVFSKHKPTIFSEVHRHGELWGEGNYDEKVCCNFEGTHSYRPLMGNVIFKLSSDTNGHGEIPTEKNYNYNVSFGGLDCRGVGDRQSAGACESDEMTIVSLHDKTNAHVGVSDEYSVKICCKWETDLYWTNLANEKIDSTSVGSTVKLIFNNSGLPTGSYDFEIKESDGLINPDDDIKTLTGTVLDNTGKLIADWTVTENDYKNAQDGILDSYPDEFYFSANTKDGTDNYLEVVFIDPGHFCFDLNEKSCNACNDYSCEAASYTVNEETFIPDFDTWGDIRCGSSLGENQFMNCFCWWNSTKDECESGFASFSPDSTATPHCKNDVQDAGETGVDCGGDECGRCENGMAVPHCKNDTQDFDEEGVDCGGNDCGPCIDEAFYPKSGTCSYSYISEDDCEDNFIESSWEVTWIWGHEGYTSLEDRPTEDIEDYVLENGFYYYDPMNFSGRCVGGSNVIPCPAEIKLPFFGFFNVVMVFILITLVYIIKRE